MVNLLSFKTNLQLISNKQAIKTKIKLVNATIIMNCKDSK